VPTLAGFTIGEDGRAVPEGGGETVDIGTGTDRSRLPAIVKASAGGGGRGMRIIADPAEAADAIACRAARGGECLRQPMVFLERYLSPSAAHRDPGDRRRAQAHRRVVRAGVLDPASHQEDRGGSASRSCPPRCASNCAPAAVAAARAVDYRGAGTVEFIVGADGTAAFLR